MNYTYSADRILHNTHFTFREWIKMFRISHPIMKVIMLRHPLASYGKWLEDYYNNPRINKTVTEYMEKRVKNEEDE